MLIVKRKSIGDQRLAINHKLLGGFVKKYEAVIGLEIHAELKTRSKMFCSCKNETFVLDDRRSALSDKRLAISTKPNWNICPVCLGMPGVLPVLNRQAIEWTILTGLALHCQIGHPIDPRQSASRSAKSAFLMKWDRKNYFYPDLPKGYQISQYDLPICYNGFLQVGDRKIGITRIHLEEDTGTSKHPEGKKEINYSLLDFNRAGVPLMELVTDPDIKTAEEAKKFCKQYQQILRTLKVADADMEKGQMRCEANVSIRTKEQRNKETKKLGTKVEIKNLNSFKAVERSIEYEIERQTGVLKSGGKIIQETRGWDDARGKTYTMRTKETSADYRYFPEPDLPPVIISHQKIEDLKKELPELPKDKAERYIKEFNLAEDEALIITSNPEKVEFFEEGIQYTRHPKDLGCWTVNESDLIEMSPQNAGELINLVKEGKISKNAAKGIFPDLKKGKSPKEIIKEKGLSQISDTSELQKTIDKIIKENPEVVESIKKGKTQAIGFLIGQVMSKTEGKANPQMVNKLTRDKLIS